MPEALISSTTSRGPGGGSGNSRSSSLRSPTNTTPFMTSSRVPRLRRCAYGWRMLACNFRSNVFDKVLGFLLCQRRGWSGRSEGAMAEQRVQRRLAAVLAADVVGYSALMQRAEEATYAEFGRLKRDLIVPALPRHDGRLIKTTGDGALVEFASPMAAVRCATEIQGHLAEGSGPF